MSQAEIAPSHKAVGHTDEQFKAITYILYNLQYTYKVVTRWTLLRKLTQVVLLQSADQEADGATGSGCGAAADPGLKMFKTSL